MSAVPFFPLQRPVLLDEAAEVARARPARAANAPAQDPIVIVGVSPLETARPGDLCFFDSRRYLDDLAGCRASACLVRARDQALLPEAVAALIVDDPYAAMTRVMGALYPSALTPTALFGASGVSPAAFVHPDARLEAGVTVDPGAVIGPGAEIGSGTIIGPHAVIGPGVCVGRGCAIGAHASLLYALVGDGVVIHPGARLGQDGFGFAATAEGYLKTPQLGRVIVQDNVEIGANTTIDRGAMRDTIIGEGSKIDNLVQIGHNVVLGRFCVIAAQTGIAGSSEIGDFVLLGGQSAIAGHLRIGAGAAIAAKSGVMRDIPAGARVGGAPARPIRRFLRAAALIDRMAGRETRE